MERNVINHQSSSIIIYHHLSSPIIIHNIMGESNSLFESILGLHSRKLIVLVSSKVNVDGVWKEMSSDYPKVETQDGKNLFIFRFPKFSSSVSYDPAIDMSSASSNQSVAPTTRSVAPTTSSAAEKNVTEEDITVNIRGKSGKIMFSRSELLLVYVCFIDSLFPHTYMSRYKVPRE